MQVDGIQALLDTAEASPPVSKLQSKFLKDAAVQVSVVRFDQVDSALSGNKLYKLIPWCQRSVSEGYDTLVSFGGWHSNHLHALAAAGHRLGLKTVGYVRGYSHQPESPTIRDLKTLGMELVFVSRGDYRLRHSPEYLSEVSRSWPNALIIPEGGAGPEGVEGGRLMAGHVSRLIQSDVIQAPDIVMMPVGTATTFAGFVDRDPARGGSYVGVAAVDDVETMMSRVQVVLNAASLKGDSAADQRYARQWHINRDYTCGGFGKMSPSLAAFITRFESVYGVPLDPVYNAKAFYGLEQKISGGTIPAGTHVLMVHTGGLQGRRGMQERIEKLTSASA
ncbi:D-cysteine desulfhydrase [BD1-7 clade bacterium]|uniref:D-cysteine desulfhydrase n=1 Tax=BD1-7 clade bacterium TaxID=2029982 RepID=A0A5S9P021_9GAMM|nr:D-cysteine desulfhydrase [BD1-7 clade bacterium]CAA0115725.1 D-cysteine desulfhydrase [BD1-7 clade bacterium]CAA0119413.1 D-cysteine desulfhydrase [BD1-7 clade bacterium]